MRTRCKVLTAYRCCSGVSPWANIFVQGSQLRRIPPPLINRTQTTRLWVSGGFCFQVLHEPLKRRLIRIVVFPVAEVRDKVLAYLAC